MSNDQPPGTGSWRRENDGPREKIEMKTARCTREGCGHSQAQHGGRSCTGACNGSHYGGYSSRSCFCERFKSPASDDPTPAQIADLRRCIAHCDATRGSFDYPNGDAIALRTGVTLERRGWVVWANKGSANRRRRWLPTDAGRAAFAAYDREP